MAATFSDLATISQNANFQGRVTYAMMVAAENIYTEPTNTVGHVKRAAFASQVVNGNFNIQAAAELVLTNATIAAEANVLTTPGYAIPDADIQFSVNSIWNTLAGA